MGKFAALAAAAMIFLGNAPAANLAEGCKAAYLMDAESGTVVFSNNETARLPIASMCKIMTLDLCFTAAEAGKLDWNEEIAVSEHAAGMGGSQVFLGAGLKYKASELIKAVAVCSANDACVALAERVGGSEEGFVAEMNARAKQLGASDTLFANCTGLPRDPQYSCAKDVAVMLKSLISHKKYFDYSKIWMEDFAHPDGRTTRITNTNKLSRFYEGCDGGKTGFTNEAGSCLAATAKRGNTRVIAVVIGADNSKARNAQVSSMFDYAFGQYETKVLLTGGVPLDGVANVQGSKRQVRYAAANDLTVFGKKGNTDEIKVEIELLPDLKAPLYAGDPVGKAILYRGGIAEKETPLVSLEDAQPYSWWEAMQEIARDWQ